MSPASVSFYDVHVILCLFYDLAIFTQDIPPSVGIVAPPVGSRRFIKNNTDERITWPSLLATYNKITWFHVHLMVSLHVEQRETR